jgi:hypothetical protein
MQKFLQMKQRVQSTDKDIILAGNAEQAHARNSWRMTSCCYSSGNNTKTALAQYRLLDMPHVFQSVCSSRHVCRYHQQQSSSPSAAEFSFKFQHNLYLKCE